MDKKSLTNTQTLAIVGVGVVLAAATLYYQMKQSKSTPESNQEAITQIQSQSNEKVLNDLKEKFQLKDSDFENENIVSYQKDAEVREAQLEEVSYNLLVRLNQNQSDGFSGCFETIFKLLHKEKDLFLDFQGLMISAVQINGEDVTKKVKFTRHKIFLPMDKLKLECSNTVRLYFKNTYVNNSSGLHYYQDPKDNLVYIFSHLEPFFCHRFFPCFDQPSVRAQLKLQVLTPQEKWKVIANEAETQAPTKLMSEAGQQLLEKSGFKTYFIENDSQNLENLWLWNFSQTPSISSYIYNLCAGDFAVIKNERTDAVTPMRIYVRQSKKDYVDSDLVFRVLTRGMIFYSSLFDCPFPFNKYDVIYCPEFRITAMENVGAVTFTDRVLIPLDELDDVIKMRHYQVHLHELAHMWFGDLTTMIWWNDLWLKESFADFLCAISFNESVFDQDPSFNSVNQIWHQFLSMALECDLKPSTHPISQTIEHTGDAVSTFDAISYKKGASWIKTMDYFLGRPTLQLATQKYVKKYAYKNAALDQFVECLQEALKETIPDSKLNLKAWTDSWLKTSGPSQIACDFSTNDQTLKITQSFPKYAEKVFREQSIEVTLIFEGFHSVVLPNIRVQAQETTSVSVKDQIEKVLQGKPVVAVMPNSGNHGYCRVILSNESIDHFVNNLMKAHINTFDRTYLWRILFDHVYMQQLPANIFVQMVIQNLSEETQPHVIPFILHKTYLLLNYKLQGETKSNELTSQLRSVIELKLKSNLNNSSLRNLLLDFYILLSQNIPQQVEELKQMIATAFVPGCAEYPDIVNKSQRYACIRKLIEWGEEADEMIQKEFSRNYSASDEIEKLKLVAADPKQKQAVWDRYVSKTESYKQEDFIASSSCFYNATTVQSARHFIQLWFEQVENIEDNKHRDYFKVFFLQLCPSVSGNVTAEDIDKLRAMLVKYEKTEKSFLRRCLIEEIDTIENILSLKSNYQH